MSLISLAIDTRAPAPIRGADYGAPVTHTPLDAGTVWAVTDDAILLAVWYLDAGMLLSTVRTGELTARALQLRDTVSAWSYLIIGGALTGTKDGATNHNGVRTGWPWASVQGALLAVQEAGVGVLSAYDAEQAPKLITQLGNARRSAAKRIRPPRDVLFFGPGEDMLLAIPGLGDRRLDAVLAFSGGNVAQALQALTDPTIAIPGVPRSAQEETRKALGLEDGVRLGFDLIEEAIHDPNSNNGHNGADQLAGVAVAADA